MNPLGGILTTETKNSKPHRNMSSKDQMTTLHFLLFLLFLTSVSPISCQKVSAGYYYQSLCQFCAYYSTTTLSEIFQNGLIDFVDLHVVPWGNARIKPPSGAFNCQNGPFECYLNTVEACAIDVWPDVNVHFAFINCVASLVDQGGDVEQKWKTCFENLGLNGKAVVECSQSERGKEIERRFANETPPHDFVPWVVVDGKPLYTDFANLKSYICTAYKGTPVPPACNQSFAPGLNLMEKTNFTTQVQSNQYIQA